MAMSNGQEFSPQPFIETVSPIYSSASMSDSSDRESPTGALPATPQEGLEVDGDSQNSEENRTLTAEDEEVVQHLPKPRRVSSAGGSSSIQSHSPKSDHNSSDFSQDQVAQDEPNSSLTSKQRYKVATEATKHSKGRKKRSTNSHPVEESGTVLVLLPKESYYDWNHRQSKLNSHEVLAKETHPINENMTVKREVELLPLLTEENGDRIVKLLIGITVEDKKQRNFSYETEIDVRLYDSKKLKVLEERNRNFKFAESTNVGYFVVELVPYNKLKEVEPEQLQVRVATKVNARDLSDQFVIVACP